jgi:hypothetical protein
MNPRVNASFKKFKSSQINLEVFLIDAYQVIDQTDSDILTLEYAIKNFPRIGDKFTLEELKTKQLGIVRDYEEKFEDLIWTMKEEYSSTKTDDKTTKPKNMGELFFYPESSLLKIGNVDILISREGLERTLMDCLIKVQPGEVYWEEVIEKDDSVNVTREPQRSQRAVRDAHNRINRKVRINTTLKVNLIVNRRGNYKLTKKVTKR